jgi:hypothetical protein
MVLFKDDRSTDRTVIDLPDAHEFDAFSGIRCPVCSWQPDAGSLWACNCRGTPEPPFQSCGTVWNTFATTGRCPGCEHQWHWTSCLRCGQWSPHVDWYVDPESGG